MKVTENMTAFVYFAWPKGDCYIKIGYSSNMNTLNGRFKTLQTGSPRPIVPLLTLPFANGRLASDAEKKLHRFLKAYRSSGSGIEWFRLDKAIPGSLDPKSSIELLKHYSGEANNNTDFIDATFKKFSATA